MLPAFELEEDFYYTYYDPFFPIVYVDYVVNVAVFDVKGRLLRGRVTKNQRKRFHDSILFYFQNERENERREKWDRDNFIDTLKRELENDAGEWGSINTFLKNLKLGHIDIRKYDNNYDRDIG